YYDRVEPSICEHDIFEHSSDTVAVCDVTRQPDSRTAIADSRSRNTDTLAIHRNYFACGLIRCRLVEIDTGDVRPFFYESMSGGFSDAAAGADNGDDSPVELLFRRQPAEFRLFKRPVLYIKSFLLVHCFVLIDGLSAAHHLDGAVVKLRGDTRLALVLAPGDHPQSRHEHNRGISISHKLRISPLTAIVIVFVFATILNDRFTEP